VPDTLRGDPDGGRGPEARGTDALLARLDARRFLAARQLAIEDWLADWRRAAAAEARA
jgi:hypothetical protein